MTKKRQGVMLGGTLGLVLLAGGCATPEPPRSYYAHYAPDYEPWEFPYAAAERELEVVLHGLPPEVGFTASLPDSLAATRIRATTDLTTDPISSALLPYRLHIMINPVSIREGRDVCRANGVESIGPTSGDGYDLMQLVFCRSGKRLADIVALVDGAGNVTDPVFERVLRDTVAIIAHPPDPSMAQTADLSPESTWEYIFEEPED